MSEQPQPPRPDHQWLDGSEAPAGPPPGAAPASQPPSWGPPGHVGGYQQPSWGAPMTDAFGRPITPQPGMVAPGGAPTPPAPASATWALVLGIVGLVLCPLLASIPAWIVGAQARQEARNLPGQPGQGMATAGMVLGIVATVIWSLFLVLVLIGIVIELEEFETASALLGITL